MPTTVFGLHNLQIPSPFKGNMLRISVTFNPLKQPGQTAIVRSSTQLTGTLLLRPPLTTPRTCTRRELEQSAEQALELGPPVWDEGVPNSVLISRPNVYPDYIFKIQVKNLFVSHYVCINTYYFSSFVYLIQPPSSNSTLRETFCIHFSVYE